MRLVLAALLMSLSSSAFANDAELRQKIVGTWTLVSVVYEDTTTKERTPVYGEHPKGIQIATPEGRWLALVTAEGRPIPKTDEEKVRALQTMIAYTGRYRVEDEVTSVGAGDVLFCAAHAAHGFEDISADFSVWVLFYGPQK